ncbi:hypothetical protein ACJJTC_009858 [Scirpophaga incertulas]
MVCKEDVVSWFKELESYKRIDAMCTLLDMCLPFELRFIGTYVEELGRRDFLELRGAELRANNPTDLAADIGDANTDSRTRRKMALYVSLLRSCNYACATTLYNAMVSLEQSGLLKGLYGDLLEEIFLLYTMALHHPAFTFDQKSHFGEILDKLKLEDQSIHYQEQQELLDIASMNACHSSMTPNMTLPPPNLTGLGPPPGIMFVKASGLQPSTDSISQELNSPPVLTGAGTVIPMLGEVTHPPPGLPIPQYSIGEYMGQHTWPANIIVSTLSQPLEVINYQQGPASPLMSSPGDSRSGSPRPRRRLSRDHSPPLPVCAPEPLSHLASNFDNMSLTDLQHSIGDERLREFSSAHHYRSLEKLNGVRQHGYQPGLGSARSSSDSGSSTASSPPGTPAPMGRAPLPFLPYPRYAYPTPAYRPPFATVPNGEPAPYHGYGSFVPVLYAQTKLSCYNCGATGHAGHDCKEPSMEEMTRAGGYQLDFAGATTEQTEK